MSVDDFGLEVLKKSAEEVTPGDKSEYVLKVTLIPDAPTLNSVTPANQKNTLDWTAVAGAVDYTIFFNTTGDSVVSSDTKIVTGSTSNSYEHTGLTNGTTYYYRVRATASIGNSGLSNQLDGTPASYINVKSTVFDGINEYINFGNPANHNFENNETFTLSFWIKLTSLSGTNKCLWAKATNDANVYGWGLYIQNNAAIFLQIRAVGQSTSHTTTAGDVSAGVWQHIVMTYNGAQNINGARLYVDASILTTPASAIVTNTLISTANSQIGMRNAAFPYYGNVDEVTFWNTDFDSTEVTELYNLGTPDDPNNHSLNANLVNWYKAGDGDTFPTWSDSVSSDDGTMTNMESGDFVSDVA